ncbi:S1 RNA-binding domain-containing protein [Streptococcaceae bacterium ESL0729]|nr:S1 RNA-binding domain-containing protein [Streptococcaceae bacterium ESL0729]
MNKRRYEISNITRFGIFVGLDNGRTGLARWVNVPKKGVYHKGDLVLVDTLEEDSNGKISLAILPETFSQKYDDFLETSYEVLLDVQEKNKEIRKILDK